MACRTKNWGASALLLALVSLSACGAGGDTVALPQAEAPSAATVAEAAAVQAGTTVPVEAVATLAPAIAETAAEAPEAAPAAPVDWLQTASVEGDYFVLGNPEAPVRILDYSDFL